MGQSLVNDLKAVFGAGGYTSIAHLTAAESTQIYTGGPAEVYAFFFDVSAGGGGDARWTVWNTTATTSLAASGVGLMFTFRPLGATHVDRTFFRAPLYFDRGILVSFTATGTGANFSRIIHWSPVNTANRGGQ